MLEVTMLMIGMVAMMAAQVVGSSGSSSSSCSSYVGRQLTPSSFADLWRQLPEVAPKGQFESSADYERRLAEAQGASREPVFVRGARPADGLSYNADRQELTIYGRAFGAGRINFRDVFGFDRSKLDNFSSAIGFELESRETSRETYQATNAFGARADVLRTNREVDTIWERAGRLGESSLVEMPAYGPVRMKVAPRDARDVIENGSTAFLLTPKPPFRRTGSSGVAPSFGSPRERVDSINVIISDIRCAFLLSGSGRVVLALTVR
jgi:hypothetical protein